MNNSIRIRNVVPVQGRRNHVIRPIRPVSAMQAAPRLRMCWSVSPDTRQLTASWHAALVTVDEGAGTEPGLLRGARAFPRRMPGKRLRHG